MKPKPQNLHSGWYLSSSDSYVVIIFQTCFMASSYLILNAGVLIQQPKWSSHSKMGKQETIVIDSSVQFSSVTQSCLTLCYPMNCSTPGLPDHHQLPEILKLMSIELVMPSNHLILCRPLLLPPPIFPNIRVFSSKSVLCIRWPKYWSFSFSISSSKEYSGLIFL